MRKIEQVWKRYYKPLIIFKDDIEKIIEAAKTKPTDEHTPEDSATIILDEFELDEPEEIGQIKKDKIKNLYIGVSEASLQLVLGHRDAYLWVSDKDDNMLMGIANRIDEILRDKQRLFGFLGSSYSVWLTMGVISCIVMAFAFIVVIFHIPFSFPLWVALGVIVYITIGVYSIYIQTHVSTIYMCHSYEKANFFKRNKDQILVVVITCVITFLLTLIGTLLVQWITKPNP